MAPVYNGRWVLGPVRGRLRGDAQRVELQRPVLMAGEALNII